MNQFFLRKYPRFLLSSSHFLIIHCLPGITGVMENASDTTGINFILLGLFDYTQTHRFLAVVLMAFLTSLMGNTFMIMLIGGWIPQLHTPMYFLLSQLSSWTWCSLTIVPKMAANYLMRNKSISPAGCGTQIFLFLTLGGGQCFLTAMSYDRYVAVCHPLRYPILMNQKLCLHMTAGSWLLGGWMGWCRLESTLSFPYRHSGSQSLLLRGTIACSPCLCWHSDFEFFMYVCCILMLLIPSSLILASQSHLAAVLNMQSTAARKKAFATCSSHLAARVLLWHYHVYLHAAKILPFRDTWQGGFCFLHHLHPVLNPYIQCEE